MYYIMYPTFGNPVWNVMFSKFLIPNRCGFTNSATLPTLTWLDWVVCPIFDCSWEYINRFKCAVTVSKLSLYFTNTRNTYLAYILRKIHYKQLHVYKKLVCMSSTYFKDCIMPMSCIVFCILLHVSEVNHIKSSFEQSMKIR